MGRRAMRVADVPLTRNSARAVPARLATGKQGANRMNGLVARDSAQRRPITSIGRMREFSNSSLFACPPPGRPAVAAPCSPPPGPGSGRHHRQSARCSKTTAPEPDPGEIRAKVNATASWSSTMRTRCPTRPLWPPPARRRTPGGRRHLEQDVCRPKPGVGCRAQSRTLCREYDRWEYPRNRDSMHVRARQGSGPGRLWPRTRRFPTPRRVRPRRDSSHSRANHGRMYPSGHDEPLRRRRHRVIRQDRSARGGPAQQVDTVVAVGRARASDPLELGLLRCVGAG